MKKSLIAGASALALGVAVIPAAGVFAADGNKTITDTIEITIDSACAVTATNTDNTYAATMTNGQLKSDLGSTEMTVKCNDNAGWQLNAVGSGAATDKTQLKASNAASTNIATGTATSGNTSNWAMKVDGNKTIAAFQNFAAVPASDTAVASDTGATDMKDGTTVTSTYQVFISQTQQADTYTGQVTYTLVHPKAS